MMNETKKYLGWLIVVVAILLIAGYLGVSYPIPAPPSPPLSPPSQTQSITVGGRPTLLTLNTAAIVTTTSYARNWGEGGFSVADVYYSIDQTDVATLTLTLQVSPDAVTWMNHSASSAVVSENAADASGYLGGIVVHLPYFRVTATVSNTNTVTPTVKVYLH
jgi:hypothetical protein